MKIRSAVPENGCLVFFVTDGKKQKNICKTYTLPPHWRLRKWNRNHLRTNAVGQRWVNGIVLLKQAFCIRVLVGGPLAERTALWNWTAWRSAAATATHLEDCDERFDMFSSKILDRYWLYDSRCHGCSDCRTSWFMDVSYVSGLSSDVRRSSFSVRFSPSAPDVLFESTDRKRRVKNSRIKGKILKSRGIARNLLLFFYWGGGIKVFLRGYKTVQ